jgi:RHS repeat-associated protein
VPYLFANGIRVARAVFEAPLDGEPRVAGAALHVFFEIGDHLGSPSVVIDKATGELVERNTYQASGGIESDYRPERWQGFREDYRFTGKEEDVEVGLQFFGKRFYSPALGRWLSSDPLALHASASNADLNLYAYVRGQLLNAVDPLGLEDAQASTKPDSWDDAGLPNWEEPAPMPDLGTSREADSPVDETSFCDCTKRISKIADTVRSFVEQKLRQLNQAKAQEAPRGAGRYPGPPQDPVLFGQRGVSPTFSKEGSMKGADINEVAAKLKSGEISSDALPIWYIDYKGYRVAVNNRSLAALSKAGMKPTKLENKTGKLPTDPSHPDTEEKVLERLREMGGRPSESIPIRQTDDHDSPARETVFIVRDPE